MTEEQQEYLERFLESIPVRERQSYSSFSAGYFCADKKNANICSDLVKSGAKTATCSMKYWYETKIEPMPVVGHLQVVTDWEGRPTAIIETLEVSEASFHHVTAEFARAEGEGDGSLEWWREVHWNYFSRECFQNGIESSKEMTLVLERFKVVYS